MRFGANGPVVLGREMATIVTASVDFHLLLCFFFFFSNAAVVVFILAMDGRLCQGCVFVER